MMNEIKELKNINNKEFIIEISLILIESQKTITISLFISAPITALQLKEFISKDFGFDIQNMIIFYPLKGIINNTYKFQAEPNEKICVNLILDDKKIDINKLNNEISLKNIELKKIKNNNFFDINLLNNQNNINNLIKNNCNIKTADIINDKKGCHLFNSKNISDTKKINDISNIKDNNINKNINLSNNESQKNNNIKINNKANINQIKINKCNFVLTKIDNKQKSIDDFVLGKKRNNPATFKTTILNPEHEETKTKVLTKGQNNSSFKIVNFSVNKSHNS
jgi:hypothetical protein